MSVRPPSRLRIDFQVRELTAEAGQEPRYVTFGDEVDMGRKVKDFFDRCGIAVDIMFQGYKTSKYIKQLAPTNQKIPLIKLVRSWTNVGLKHAKDLVELPMGRPMVLFKEGRDADAMVQICRNAGMPDVVAEPVTDEMFHELSLTIPQYIAPVTV